MWEASELVTVLLVGFKYDEDGGSAGISWICGAPVATTVSFFPSGLVLVVVVVVVYAMNRQGRCRTRDGRIHTVVVVVTVETTSPVSLFVTSPVR